MTKMLSCRIAASSSAYNIEIHRQLLDQPTQLVAAIGAVGERFAVITHETIAPLYAEKITAALAQHGFEGHLFTFPPGEQHKTRATKERLENQLLEKGLGKDTCIIALGGGVVTDVAGYIAATYCRGLPLVSFPTSLLGMVDASIGGKTGVNVPQGKNMIGCIYQPSKVLIDLSTLHSLPLQELRNGIVEMIKHGLIVDAAYFDYLDSHAGQLLQLEPHVLESAVFDSCRIKKEIVEQDEREKGLRHLLNLGHTIGHALERLTDYALPHGEAVAIGLLVESHLAVQLGHLPAGQFDRIRSILKKYALPLKLPGRLTEAAVMDAMKMDKKSRHSQPRFVILDDIGAALPCALQYCMSVDNKLVKNAIQWMNDDLCRH